MYFQERLTHETSWVGRIGTDFAIDFDQTLLYNCENFTTRQSIF